MTGQLLVISGPSAGVGKDTILRLFLEKHPDWHQPLSTLTRPIRPGEIDGKDHRYVSDEQFKTWQAEDKFLESDFHAGYWYGTLRQPVEDLLADKQNVVLRVDVNGAMAIKQAIPEAMTVFIDGDDQKALEKRIRQRAEKTGETEAQIQDRLALGEQELKLKPNFDHIVVNPHGHPEKAVADIEKLLNL